MIIDPERDWPFPRSATLPGDLPQRLKQRLELPLPGRAAQALLEPDLSYGRHAGPPQVGVRNAAVVIALYQEAGEWRFPLTVRPKSLPLHGGQISLPGGLLEGGEQPHEAALREWEEELGVPADDLVLLGRLSPLYVYVSNFLVEPWVAVVPRRPEFRPNPQEVAEVVEASLATFFEPASHGVHVERRGGLEWTVPHWETHGRHVWGATGMILAEFAVAASEAIVK